MGCLGKALLLLAGAVGQGLAQNCPIGSAQYSRCFEGGMGAGWQSFGATGGGHQCCTSYCPSGCLIIGAPGSTDTNADRGMYYESNPTTNSANVFTTYVYSGGMGKSGTTNYGGCTIRIRNGIPVSDKPYFERLYERGNNLYYYGTTETLLCSGCMPSNSWISLEILFDAPNWDKFRVCVDGSFVGLDHAVLDTGKDGIVVVDLGSGREDVSCAYRSAVWSTRASTTGCVTCSTNPANPCPTPSPTAVPTPAPSESPTSPTQAPSTDPSPPPSGVPSTPPSASPSAAPTLGPTPAPSLAPSSSPSATPTSAPSTQPTLAPLRPSLSPSVPPSASPSASPSPSPSGGPTQPPLGPTPAPVNPTTSPSPLPTAAPTAAPSAPPSQSPLGPTPSPVNPTESPTLPPSASPTAAPSLAPSRSPLGPTPSPIDPTESPTMLPTQAPTRSPSTAPSQSPLGPTPSPISPTSAPSELPSLVPSGAPSEGPTAAPSAAPLPPTAAPSSAPSAAPSGPPLHPSQSPSAAPSPAPSAAPSNAPSFAPTRAPSGSPSRLPTARPSAPPSVSPSVAPSLPPSVPPSPAPTTSPSRAPTARPSVPPSPHPSQPPTLRPSAGPTRDPTTSPTSAPSWGPSAAPSVPPSLSPSRRPSAAPSRAPTAGPSAAPSGGPSRPPSAAPSAVPSLPPSGGPTAPPTAAPSNPPSASPLFPPTSVPTLTPDDGADPTSGVVATSGTLAALPAASVASAAQSSRLALLAAGCTAADISKEDLPFALHPTGLEIRGQPLPKHAGCVAMAIALFCGLTVFHLGAATALSQARHVAMEHAQGMLRAPTFSMILGIVLSQGGTFCGGRLLKLSAGDVVSLILGVIAVLMGLCGTLGLLRFGRAGSQGAVYKQDRSTRGRCARSWLGPGEWLSLDHSWAVERLGGAFRAALPERHAVLALDCLTAQVAMLSAGLGGGSCSACAAGRMVDIVLSLLFTAYLLLRAPYARPVRLPLTVASQLFLAAGSGALGLGFFSPECEGGASRLPGHTAATVLLTASGVCTVLVLLLDGSAALRVMQLRRRPQLLEAVMHFRAADADSTGLTAAQLHAVLEEQWGRRISETELQQLFKVVDTDCSGFISLREFLAAEHLFWDVGEGAPQRTPQLANSIATESPLTASASIQRSVSCSTAPRRRGGPCTPKHGPQTPRRRKAREKGREQRADTREGLELSVSGAGTSRVNGIYDPATPPASSRRLWRQRHGGTVVSQSPRGSWVMVSVRPKEDDLALAAAAAIADPGDDQGCFYRASADGSAVPPRAGWTPGPRGIPPAPSVELRRVTLPLSAASAAAVSHRARRQPPKVAGEAPSLAEWAIPVRSATGLPPDMSNEEPGDLLSPLPNLATRGPAFASFVGTPLVPPDRPAERVGSSRGRVSSPRREHTTSFGRAAGLGGQRKSVRVAKSRSAALAATQPAVDTAADPLLRRPSEGAGDGSL
eukprot:TRINITY_DN26067_c0_g1_i1.p1 TRINITY_DN26067_c0_g1~~TRINITY_DN26067_c0_g1_i1.p1  ORF type:complete len:1486 (+),score=195.57 TRINITY_DN26067_c0_g1_i1:65-4459(+)